MKALRYIFLFCLAALLLACVREDLTEPSEEATPSDKLCLRLGDVDTKLSYSGTTTTFSDGDYIGAVVCKLNDSGSYEYNCTMRWKYNSDGKITPDKIWTYSSDDSSWSLNSSLSYSADADDPPLFTYDSDSYVVVNSNEDLFLFFYYPFIDTETTQSDVPSYTSTESSSEDTDDTGEDSSSETSTTNLLMGMAGPSEASNVTTTSTSDDGSSTNTSVPSFDWESFPMFVNKDQSTSAKHQMSDFLWSNFTIGINSSSTGDHYVSFSKMTATIRVSSYKEIESIRLYSASSEDLIVIGQKIDLKDADLLDFESSDDVYSYSTLGTDEYLVPYNNTSSSSDDSDDETTYYYRFLLPQQASFSGTLKVKFADDSSTEESVSSLSKASAASSGRIVPMADSDTYSLTLSCVDASNSETSISPTIYYYTGDSAPSEGDSSWNTYSSAVSVTSGATVYYYASATGYTSSSVASTTVYADTQVQFSLSATSSSDDSSGGDSSDSSSNVDSGSDSGSSDSTGSYGSGSSGDNGGPTGGGMTVMADDETSSTTSYNVTLGFVDSDSDETVSGATIYYQIVSSDGSVGDTWSTYSSAVSVTSGYTIYYYASATGYSSSSTSACSAITSATAITVDLVPESYAVTLTAVDASGSTISGATMYYQIGSTSGDWSSTTSGSSVSVLYGRTIYYYATYDGDDYVSGSSSSASSSTITAATSLTYSLSDYWDINTALSFTSLATGCIYYVDIVEYSVYCYFDNSSGTITSSTYSTMLSDGTTSTDGLVTNASGVFSWGFDNTSGSPSTFVTTSATINGVVSGVESFSYLFKLEGSPKTYLQLVLSRKSDITVYLVYQSSAPKVKLVNSSDTTIDTQTATASSDNGYMTLKFSDIAAGTYKLMRSSGSCQLLLVTIESS